jgi:hypothetical protein
LTVRNLLFGLGSLAVPASFFSTAVLLSYGYASQLVYTIGDTSQLDPLFLGVVLGSILFSVAGFVARSTWRVLLYETIIASVLLAASYAAMVADSLVLGGTLIFVVSLSMTSVSAPAGTLLRLSREAYSVRARALLGAAQAGITILSIFVFALYYEENGQLNFFIGPMIFLVISLVCFLILLRAK